MKNQLIKLMKDKDLTATRFADAIGVQRSSISHILSGRNKPSYDFILKIVEKFPDVNIKWLITGEGERKEELSGEELAQHDNKLTFTEVKNSKDYTMSDENIKKNIDLNSKITNVNKIHKVILLFTDGSFMEYNSR